MCAHTYVCSVCMFKLCMYIRMLPSMDVRTYCVYVCMHVCVYVRTYGCAVYEAVFMVITIARQLYISIVSSIFSVQQYQGEYNDRSMELKDHKLSLQVSGLTYPTAQVLLCMGL